MRAFPGYPGIASSVTIASWITRQAWSQLRLDPVSVDRPPAWRSWLEPALGAFVIVAVATWVVTLPVAFGLATDCTDNANRGSSIVSRAHYANVALQGLIGATAAAVSVATRKRYRRVDVVLVAVVASLAVFAIMFLYASGYPMRRAEHSRALSVRLQRQGRSPEYAASLTSGRRIRAKGVVVAESGVRLTANRRFGQFLVTRPVTVEIDGSAARDAPWGHPEFFAADTGPHQITVFFRYLGKKRTGEASVQIEVADDQTVDLLYRSPWVLTNKGSLTIR